jgi:hypothetical protein
MVTRSHLVDWQRTVVAGLTDKEDKLRSKKSVAKRQKVKIEEMRKTNNVVDTDLTRSKEENL